MVSIESESNFQPNENVPVEDPEVKSEIAQKDADPKVVNVEPIAEEKLVISGDPFKPFIKEQDLKEHDEGVNFEKRGEFENVWMVSLDESILKECSDYDEEWRKGKFGFEENISSDFPDIMAPRTGALAFKKSGVLGKMMESRGFDIKPWNVKGDKVPYAEKLLQRHNVPDTYKPIFHNTDILADHLNEITVNSKEPLRIRSVGTGSGVAEKALLSRLHGKYGITDLTLVSTDLAENSIAAAAINLSLFNEKLPEEQRYTIHIVKGEIPDEMYKESRSIILQVADAKNAMAWEKDKNIGYDALSLDNILPYLSHDLNDEILSSVMSNKGSSGLMVTTLGLDANIKVELDKLHQYKEIINPFKNLMKSYRNAYERNGSLPIHNGYWHKYGFHIRNDGSILIDKVMSEGAAKMFTWIRKLIFNGQIERIGEVTKTIEKATSLSSAKEEVQSPPFETFVRYMKLLNASNAKYEVKEAPLYPEKFGFTIVPGSDYEYRKGGQGYTYEQVMMECRKVDPVVLRGSCIYIE